MNLFHTAAIGRTLFLAATLCAATAVRAEPITYTMTGVATGTLRSFQGNTTAFADRPFAITVQTDTSNISTERFGAGIPATTALVRAAITLADVLSSPLSDPLYVFNNQASQTVGFGDLLHNDLMSVRNVGVGLGSYGLVGNLGPISGFNAATGQFSSVLIDQGALTFSRLDNASFQAALAAVPEPQSWGLMALGLAVVGAIARRGRAAA